MFAILLEGTPASRRFFAGFAKFIGDVTTKPGSVTSKGTLLKALTLREESIDVGTVSALTQAEVKERMQKGMKGMVERSRSGAAKAML